MFKKWSGFMIIAACFLVVAACGNSSSKGSSGSSDKKSGKLHVVTTFYPMYEFTKQIVKDKGDVDMLIPSSVEPHDWEPTPKDIASIQKADLFVYNSTYMETWVPSAEKSMGADHAAFVKASKGIDLIEGSDEEEEGHGHDHNHSMDPHVWLSPVLAQKEVKNITAQIVKQDPKNKAYYEKNSEEYIAKLKDLDKLYRTTLNKAAKKELITQHAAFGYLAKEYGLKQVAIAGLSPEEEPSAAKLAELKTFAKKHDVKIIYFEEVASPKVANTLAGEIGAKTEVLNTLEGLSQKERDKGIGYIDIMEKNLDALKDSLLVK
ncbi:metal ABC transporter substrate-binding protein [Bacillus nakamurai]|uniref:Zinc ABC transporter substrate-binding protein n=1 Tax=Bacillus nakamurai TaxID=1793963 RepID=A0A150FCA8_9BACI|nr:metal ABC transporter substrate-binding protein [Bacillus nakamurai]KXZ23386.1 zinc ABC transporter substrate-binding protein [Bacillus nakamurai]MED1226483.1 metal ABC transporter substrate-binding protein [Bacillus nakamurai]